MKKQIILILLLVVATGRGQTDSLNAMHDKNIYSLKIALRSATNDTVKCNILSDIIAESIDYSLIIKCCENIISIAENSKDLKLNDFYLKQLAFAYEMRGLCLSRKGDIIQALDNFNRSLKINRTLGLKEDYASSLLNIGAIYHQQGDYTNALQCYKESAVVQKEINDNDGLSNSLVKISTILNEQGKTDSALSYAKRSLKLKNNFETLNTIGLILSNKGESDAAIDYFTKALNLAKGKDDKTAMKAAMSLAYHCMSSEFFKQKKYTKAIEYGELALTNSKESGNPDFNASDAKILRDAYKAQNKPVQALEMFELFIKMRDSISNQQTRKAVIQKQYQIEYEKKALADSLKANQERNFAEIKSDLEINKRETQKMYLYLGLVAVLIFAGFIFNRFEVTKKQKAVIENHQKEILDSIHYAKRIQNSLLPTEKYIEKTLNRLRL
jgi:tetratricopeptide (TPR) repeat protein